MQHTHAHRLYGTPIDDDDDDDDDDDGFYSLGTP
jgi:hypothetical protein